MNSDDLKYTKLSLRQFQVVAERITPITAELAAMLLTQTPEGRAGEFDSLNDTFCGWGVRLIKAYDAAVGKEKAFEELEAEVIRRKWFVKTKQDWLN